MQPKTQNDMFKVIIFMANNNKLYFDNVYFLTVMGDQTLTDQADKDILPYSA